MNLLTFISFLVGIGGISRLFCSLQNVRPFLNNICSFSGIYGLVWSVCPENIFSVVLCNCYNCSIIHVSILVCGDDGEFLKSFEASLIY